MIILFSQRLYIRTVHIEDYEHFANLPDETLDNSVSTGNMLGFLSDFIGVEEVGSSALLKM